MNIYIKKKVWAKPQELIGQAPLIVIKLEVN